MRPLNSLPALACSLFWLQTPFLTAQVINRPPPRRDFATVASTGRLWNLPPGIVLGQEPAATEAILNRAGVKITNRENDGFSDKWSLEGLFITRLESASFYFADGHLDEIELHFGRKEWPEKRFNQLLDDLRIRLEHDYGYATNAFNDEATDPSGVKQHVQGSSWLANDVELKLSYFTAEGKDKSAVFRSVTINFRKATPTFDPFAASANPADLLMPNGPQDGSLALLGENADMSAPAEPLPNFDPFAKLSTPPERVSPVPPKPATPPVPVSAPAKESFWKRLGRTMDKLNTQEKPDAPAIVEKALPAKPPAKPVPAKPVPAKPPAPPAKPDAMIVRGNAGPSIFYDPKTNTKYLVRPGKER